MTFRPRTEAGKRRPTQERGGKGDGKRLPRPHGGSDGCGPGQSGVVDPSRAVGIVVVVGCNPRFFHMG